MPIASGQGDFLIGDCRVIVLTAKEQPILTFCLYKSMSYALFDFSCGTSAIVAAENCADLARFVNGVSIVQRSGLGCYFGNPKGVSRMRGILVIALALTAAGPATAAIDSAWPVLAKVSDEDCQLTITGNGRFVLIAAAGLGEGQQARYRLDNGAMKPIDWTITADRTGRFARYYVPFQWGRRGGEVQVSVMAGSCQLSASFPWERYTG